MGYFAHHAIVVSSWDEKSIKRAHKLAYRLFKGMVTNVTDAATNGERSFLVAPDGSKEGWETSERHDELRGKFKSWMRKQKSKRVWLDWVEVRFGGDEPGRANLEDFNRNDQES
jgi:hypothetical protein